MFSSLIHLRYGVSALMTQDAHLLETQDAHLLATDLTVLCRDLLSTPSTPANAAVRVDLGR